MINNYFKQQKYYYLGIFIGLSSRVKKFILGIKSPRPRMLNEQDYEANLKYNLNIIRNIQDLSADPDLFSGKRILEIGPGPDLMLGLLTLENGALSYQSIDYFPVLTAPQWFYQRMSETLKSSLAIQNAHELSNCAPGAKEVSVSNLSYQILGIENLRKTQNQYDLIISKDVLEHVDNLSAAFKEMQIALAPGGRMIHKIDFQTHTSFIQETDKLNFLRYSEYTYKKFVKFRGGPNRLRLPEVLDLATSHGFKVQKIYINKEISAAELAEIKPYLSEYYKNLPESALMPLSAWIIFTK